LKRGYRRRLEVEGVDDDIDKEDDSQIAKERQDSEDIIKPEASHRPV
jgi:hypothetical protein